MEQVGYSLVADNAEIEVWGDASGQCAGLPEVIVLENGDRVHCPEIGVDYGGRKLLPRWLDYGDAASVLISEDKALVTRVTPSIPVPEEISDRQSFQGLALQGVVSQDEALSAVKVGSIPAALQSFVDAITDPVQHFDAEMLLCGATVFKRSHPLTAQFGAAQGWPPEQIDAFWRVCAEL